MTLKEKLENLDRRVKIGTKHGANFVYIGDAKDALDRLSEVSTRGALELVPWEDREVLDTYDSSRIIDDTHIIIIDGYEVGFDIIDDLTTPDEDENIAGDYQYQMLANAIVKDACDEYLRIYRKISKGVYRDSNMFDLDRLKLFFGSSWYPELTKIDSDYLMDGLHKSVVETAGKDYVEIWKQKWKDGERVSLTLHRMEAFFRSDQFYRLSGVRAKDFIPGLKNEVIRDMKKEYQRAKEIIKENDSKKEVKKAKKILDHIESFVFSKSLMDLSYKKPEEFMADLDKK